MKVILTGGGTGGHFYPLIAVAEELTQIIDDQNIADAKIYYVSDSPYDRKTLYENGIIFRQVMAGKLRLTPSLKMIPDFIKAAIGLLQGFFTVFSIFPDVVFSKGGYAAVPTLFAARLLGIPVIIHESDSAPGRVSKWSGKFARSIAVSYKQEVNHFPKTKLVHTGQPIRRDLIEATKEGAHEFMDLDRDIPVIWVLGGSSGSQRINFEIEEALSQLLPKYQIVHQVGKKHLEEMQKLTQASLVDEEYKHRYRIFGELNQLSMKMLAGISDVVISRAGSTLFEIAQWQIPSIIIPIIHSNDNHQVKNAYNYAREGSCIVIEENNLSTQLLVSEINRIYDNQEVKDQMKEGARKFTIPGAARNIAKQIIGIGLAHDK